MHSTNITTLEQAELKIRRAGIVQDEKVEGKQLLQICGLSIKDPTDSLHKQINRHGFIAGKDFSESFRKSIGGRPGKVYHFTINAANHVLLAAMTTEGKKARQEAIDDKHEKLLSRRDNITALNKPEIYQPGLSTPQALLEMNMATSLRAMAFVEALGFTGNQKLLFTDRLLKNQIGFSPLEAMGQKQLVAPVQAMTFTPTQLGQMMEPPQDPRQVNKLLEAAGLQIKIDNLWVPTDQGQPLCEILDTGKAHNNGAPVKQVKWYQTVLDRLKPALSDEPKTESIDQDCRYADPAPEPEMIGSDTDEEPIQRKQKRKRNRYELDDYFSLVELGEFIGRSRQHVVEVLEKHRLIKWTGQGKRGKYLLTDKGWQYGLMYDPCEICFHNRDSKRLTTSNAQPVLGYDILKFF